MIEKAKELINTAVNINTLIKLGVAIGGVFFFYFQVDGHINNDDIHINYNKIQKINSEINAIKQEIKLLKQEIKYEREKIWKELEDQKDINKRRHDKQEERIKEVKKISHKH